MVSHELEVGSRRGPDVDQRWCQDPRSQAAQANQLLTTGIAGLDGILGGGLARNAL